MAPSYYSLESLLGMIDEPNSSACWRLIDDNAELFAVAAGSSYNHQAWVGGYRDHIVETMNLMVLLHRSLAATGRFAMLPAEEQFTLSDGLVVMFWHDIEKVWRWQLVNGEPLIVDGRVKTIPALRSKEDRGVFAATKIAEYGVELTPAMQNALRFVEGIRDADYTPNARLMGPLAALCHACDTFSARMFHDFPALNDPWTGAQRSAAR